MNMSVSLLTVWSGIDETVVCFANSAPMSFPTPDRRHAAGRHLDPLLFQMVGLPNR
jgi:hypothetical protein